MERSQMTQRNQADRLRIEDLLFSRTDDRGVIQAGNDVFQRISVFSWEKILGAPHKILRHDDMPSGVFGLIWQGIKAGEPMGGYIQNMAEDGVPYWVFAAILPIEGGFVSQQLKPSSGVLDIVKPIYRNLREQERDGSLSVEASAEALIAALRSEGFADYQHFMSYALREECAAREETMGRPGDPMRDRLGAMLIDIREMEASANKVEKTFQTTHQIPYNMRLQAGRLEGSDGPISVISSNHRQMTQTLEENLERFGKESVVGAEAIRLAMFKSSASLLIGEMAQLLIKENTERENPNVAETELAVLHKLSAQYLDDAVRDVKNLSMKVYRFGQHCRDMRRMMSGLELTRIMCKIERSKFDGDYDGLDEIVNRLSEAQAILNESFDSILEFAARILEQGERIQRDASADTTRQVA